MVSPQEPAVGTLSRLATLGGAARLAPALAIAFTLVSVALTARGGPDRGRACPSHHLKLDRALHAAADTRDQSPQRVIVRARPGYRRQLRRALEQHGDSVRAELPSLESFSVEIHGDDVRWLAAQADVERVSIDAPVHASGGPSGDTGGLRVLRDTLGVTSSWTGDRIGVALVDSGLEPSEDFDGRIRAFYDFTRGGVAATPTDDYGHGTHVAGLIGGEGKLSNSNEFMGVAPKVEFVVLRVLDGGGAGYTSDVIAAIDFAVRNRQALGIHIINLSLGHPVYEAAATDPLVIAVENAVRAGLVVVVAAGNYGQSVETGGAGYGGVTSPGNAPSAITVGAVTTQGTVSRHDDRVTSYSSRGPTWYDGAAKPDIVAPGHDLGASAAVQSWLYSTYPALRVTTQDGDYLRLSGTSMAAGVVTGVIAHMLEANRNTNGSDAPMLPPNAVKAVLQYTALPVSATGGSPEDSLAQGAGAVNADGAIAVARAIRTKTAQGQLWLDTGRAPSQPSSAIGGSVLPWAKVVVWGSTILTGSTIQVNHPAWATTAVWGCAKVVVWGSARVVVWGSAKVVVWGSNIVWTEPDRWATSIVWGSSAIGQIDSTARVVVWGSTVGLTPATVAWADLSDGMYTSAPSDAGLLSISR